MALCVQKDEERGRGREGEEEAAQRGKNKRDHCLHH